MLTITQFFAQYGPMKQGIAKVLETGARISGRLPVEKMNGLVHKFGKETGLGSVVTRTINKPFPTSDSSTVVPGSEPAAIGGGQVKTDYRLEEMSSNDGSARATEIARRTRNVARWMDRMVIEGDRDTDAEQIDGIRVRVKDSQKVEVATNGGGLTLTKLDAALDAVEDVGGGKLVLCNRRVARVIKRLVVKDAGGANISDVSSPIMRYEDAQIITLGRDDTGNFMLPFTETTGTNDETTSLFVIAPGVAGEKSGVQLLMASNSIEVINEGVRDSQYIDTLEVCFGLAVYQDECIAQVSGITTEEPV